MGRNSRWREGLKKSEERRSESSEGLIGVKSRDGDDVGRLPGLKLNEIEWNVG